jgi:hypothetical protein
MSFVNRAVTPTFIAPPAPRAPLALPQQVGPSMYASNYQPSGGTNSVFLSSTAGSDPIANLKVLATNVWTTMSNLASSLWASIQRLFAQK